MCRHDLVNRYSGDPELNAHFYKELAFSLFIKREIFYFSIINKDTR